MYEKISLHVLLTTAWLGRAAASLPWGSIKDESLQTTTSNISFDPLALLAILHYPRASASAAKLYSDHGLRLYRWPHLPMIGGALPPFKLLVGHLVSKRRSIHPTSELIEADTDRIEITSEIGFKYLQVNHSNVWLTDLLGFSPGRTNPRNDILIVHVDNINGERIPDSMGNGDETPWVEPVLLNLIDMTVIALLAAATVCSILTGDMWATTLFTTYFVHAIASTTLSLREMGTSHVEGQQIQRDKTIHFAVHQRPEGGKVVFIGRKHTLEAWARTEWTFLRSYTNTITHWGWMISGTIAAVASVICMVNMAGSLQLAYLGVLLISSAFEIWITRLVREMQETAIKYGDSVLLVDNETWTKAIVRSSLIVADRWSLSSLPWIKFGFLPDREPFRSLCLELTELRVDPNRDFRAILNASVGVGNSLSNRIANEIEAALKETLP